MGIVNKGFSLVLFTAMLFYSVTAYAAEKEITGQLVSLNSRNSSMTVEVEVKGMSGPEKRYMYVRIAKDARWHICLADRCVETRGAEGFRKVNDYAGFEAYGLPHKSYKITLNQKGDEATSIKVEIAPGRHKE